jgi:hypothetical protein
MENTRNLYQSIQEEELTPDLQLLAQVCGMESIRIILKEFKGLNFYIPKITRIEKFVRRYLRENQSKPPKELARELGVSENYVKKLGYSAVRKKKSDAI